LAEGLLVGWCRGADGGVAGLVRRGEVIRCNACRRGGEWEGRKEGFEGQV